MKPTLLNKKLRDAVDLFVMTKFDECFYVCEEVIKTAKCEPEQERTQELIEAATALSIQALAETDKWHQVVDFIVGTYGSIDLTPPRIIQVCILLHAHVKEYPSCHNIMKAWLNNPHNLSHCQCSKVIRIYAHHILCPTGSYEILQEIIESCQSLSDYDKSALLQLPQAGRFESARKSQHENCIEKRNKPTSPVQHLCKNSESVVSGKERDSITLAHTGLSKSESHMTGYLKPDRNMNNKRKNSCVLSKGKSASFFLNACLTVWDFFTTQKYLGLIIMGILALWAIIQTQSADPVSSLGRLVILWRFFIQKLKLFHLRS
ncbi:hypothetical protein Btru_058149 [Bulinus truncatus]|nr:hypothetical protein Btru_058149 [Bulinus truncatus]